MGQLLFYCLNPGEARKKPPLPGEVAARLRAGRKGPDGPPAASRSPLNSFHTVFHNDVENSYFSTVHNRLYLGQK